MESLEIIDTNRKAPHVGAYIKAELDAKGMRQKELAKLTGIQTSTLNDIIKGRRDITAEQSILIGHALDLTDNYFYNLQQQYDMDKARESERVTMQLDAITNWNALKHYVSESFFDKMGLLGSDIKHNVDVIFEVFGVKNLDEFFALRNQEARVEASKKTKRQPASERDLFSWKFYGKFLTRDKRH